MDPATKPSAPPRTWKVTITLTDTPGSRETYLTKEQVINAAVYANRVHGLHMVKSEARLIDPVNPVKDKIESLNREVQNKEEKEKRNA